jgi:hypothetical protein
MRKTSPTQYNGKWLGMAIALPLLLTGAAYGQYAQKNVVQPSDPIIASSANSPATENVKNAIDGTQNKYLNFDQKNNAIFTGFIVTPSVGATWVTGVAIQSANDAPERDVKSFTLEGSNDDPTNFTSFSAGNWTSVATVLNIASNNTRYAWATVQFTNYAAYKSYRWTVLETQATNGCCMQVAEVQLLGTTVPKNVVQPSDAIIASSANSPATENVKNAIDGTQNKYLNFDQKNNAIFTGFIVTPGVGSTVINGVSIQSANDAPERDVKEFTIEGSNDDPTNFTSFSAGNWTQIAHVSDIVSNNTRYAWANFLFPNVIPYTSYRWTVLQTQATNGCCMQVAEVQLNGSGAPKNVVVPTDPIIASSANSPATENVKNAIDGTQNKYLNFDQKNNAIFTGFIVTPSAGATAIIGVGIESANDAPERDVKEFTIEGSNDDPTNFTSFSAGNWNLIAHVSNIPSNNTRYAWAYSYFQNSTPYTSYRWTVLQTQATNGCCMQVAEVSLLAITSQADCTKAAFVSQPSDTPVLAGSQAQFFTSINGPWPLQWTINGQPVPGGNQSVFTTEPITALNATNVYAVQIVGCQTSAPVKAMIFTPSTTKSIGIQFGGGGANGAPEYMRTNDIAGVQQQSFWNVAVGGSGSIGDDNNPGTAVTNALGYTDYVTDSSGNTNSIMFTYATSGTWGAGVGSDQPTQRLLNGVTGAGGVATPGIDQNVYTFGNVPPGQHAILVYAVAPPTHRIRASYSVTNAPAQTTYMRIMASEEYNAAPGFYRSTSTSATSPQTGDFVRFDGVSPDVNSNITLVVDLLDAHADGRAQGVNAIQLVLNAPNPGPPPAITQAPQTTVGPAGGSVTLSVTATGNNLSYQWRKDGVPIQNGGSISGATSSTLTINPLTTAYQGVYSVAVFSPAGSTVSENVSVNISTYNIQSGLVGYWKFDETSGTNAVNSSTNGTHLPATIYTSGGGTWAAGKVANSYSFADQNTFMFVSNYAKASAGIGASCWVNLGGNSPGVSLALVQNAEPNLYTVSGNATHIIGQFEMTLVFDPNTQNMYPEAGVGVEANIFTVTGTKPVPVSGWHNVSFTADGASVRVYVDGQLSGTAAYLGTIATPSIPWLSIGARLNEDTNTYPELGVAPDQNPMFMVGQMDELAVWNRSLSPSEITGLYTTGNAGQPLTSFAQTPPATSGTLTASISGGQITVTWTSGSLQTAPSISGPWTAQATTGNSFTEPVTAGTKFYRTH